MHPRVRDGLFALVGLAVLLWIGLATSGAAAFLDPATALAGVLVAALVEAWFLRSPERALALWDRRGVPAVALCVLLAGAVLAVRSATWVIPVLAWGLVGYLALLACLLAGLGNPLAPLARRGR